MDFIKNIKDEQLNWIQPKATHQFYELRSDSGLYGNVNFPKSVGSLAEAESADGRWTFKRIGFFHTRITVRVAGRETDIAVLKPNLMASSGTLEFSGGKTFLWHASNFWATKFEFTDPAGEVIVTFRSGVDEPKFKDWFKTQARLEIPDNKKDLPELSLIALLGWYLIVVLQMDSSAGAVVSVTS